MTLTPQELAYAHEILSLWAARIAFNPDLPDQERAQRLRDFDKTINEEENEEELSEESIARFDNRFVSWSLFVSRY